MSDRYSSFEKLQASEQEGQTYCRILKSTQSLAAIVAPHGGRIEPTTDKIAQAIAGEEFNLYCFLGKSADLHITSSKFDDPDCLKMIAGCTIVITIHGLKNRPGADVLVGGRACRNALISRLIESGIPAVAADGSIAGQSSGNICNRGKTGSGIQLEITRRLRDKMAADDCLMNGFATTMRKFIFDQLDANNTK